MLKYLYNLATDKYRGPAAGLCRVLLLPFAFLYGLAVRLVSAYHLSRPKRLACKVISVGNIVVGGTGKTAVVEYICRFLKESGKKPAVLTRGYGRRSISGDGSSDYARLGDEGAMLQEKLPGVPVVADPDRIRGSEIAVTGYGAQVVVLDDGFQQWRIAKDLEIVAVDSRRMFGNGRLLPAGLLREPLVSLKRADVFFLTKTELVKDTAACRKALEEINPGALLVESGYRPQGFVGASGKELIPLAGLAGKRVMLFSGIADPGSFEKTCAGLGMEIVYVMNYPDHYHYTPQDLELIRAEASARKAEKVLTTEKDAARIKGAALDFLSLRISLDILTNREEFNDRLLRVFSA